MPAQAKVTSVDALIAFRASLVNYMSQARATAEEISSDVLRTRLWLQDDRRPFWRGQLSRRGKVLEEAKSNLYSAQVANFRTASYAEQAAVRRATEAYAEAGRKLESIKRWSREFDSRVEPVARRTERLHTFLSRDLPEAIAYLDKIIATLQDYGDMKAPSSGPPPADAASAGDPATGTSPEAAARGKEAAS